MDDDGGAESSDMFKKTGVTVGDFNSDFDIAVFLPVYAGPGSVMLIDDEVTERSSAQK